VSWCCDIEIDQTSQWVSEWARLLNHGSWRQHTHTYTVWRIGRHYRPWSIQVARHDTPSSLRLSNESDLVSTTHSGPWSSYVITCCCWWDMSRQINSHDEEELSLMMRVWWAAESESSSMSLSLCQSVTKFRPFSSYLSVCKQRRPPVVCFRFFFKRRLACTSRRGSRQDNSLSTNRTDRQTLHY